MTATHVKYLLAMHTLDSGNPCGMRCVDIANALHVSKPSVHMMLGNLREMGLIRKDRYGGAFFTEEGAALAARYAEYFKALVRRFSPMLSREDDLRAAAFALLGELSEAGLRELAGA